MKLQDLAFLACRLAALYFLYNALLRITFLLEATLETGRLTVIVMAVLHLVLAAASWFGAERISRLAGGKFSSAKVAPEADHAVLQTAVFAGVGLFLLVTGLSRFLGHMTATLNHMDDMNVGFTALLQTQQIATPLIQIVLGACVLFGAAKLSGLISGMGGGQPKKPVRARPSIREALSPGPAAATSPPQRDAAPAAASLNGTQALDEDDDNFEEIWSPESKKKAEAEPAPPPKPRTLSARAAEPPRQAPLPSPDPDYRKLGRD